MIESIILKLNNRRNVVENKSANDETGYYICHVVIC